MIRIGLAPQVGINAVDGSTLAVEYRGQRATLVGFKNHGTFLARLQHGPLSWDELPRLCDDTIDPEVTQAIHKLAARGLVRLECVSEAQCLLSATPVEGSKPIVFWSPASGERYMLSRFAYLHRRESLLVVESARSRWQVTVNHTDIVSVIASTAAGISLADMVQIGVELGEKSVSECLRFLIGVGVIMPMNSRAEPDEDTIPELAQREFHDVLMHAESRWGLAPLPIGALFSFAGTIKPAKAIKNVASDTVIKLHRPDLTEVAQKDMPLVNAMEHRRSIRRFADTPLTAEELGEFLYRVGRVRAIKAVTTDDPRQYETTDRTYPSGGATYDLEIYLTAWNCAGLSRAMYHYDPVEHALSLVTAQSSVSWRLVRDSYDASGRKGVPHVVITLASRFSRLSWKYRGIAYSTTLKNVGVLYEAMYLVATAMGLAPCALGGGNSALFSEATGLDPLVESSVGEFMLGVPADHDWLRVAKHEIGQSSQCLFQAI